jgi:hypothetical protein
MLRKIRYHHDQSWWNKAQYKGFSVMMIPVDQEYVELRHTFCSQKDAFCKKKAREELQKKEGAIIPVTLLPQAIAELRQEMYSGERNASQAVANEHAWLWKYFL